MYSIVAVHIKMLHRLSHLISCVLNRYKRHDKKDGLWVLKNSSGNGRDAEFWLLGRPEYTLIAEERGNAVFYEKDRLSQFYQENKP